MNSQILQKKEQQKHSNYQIMITAPTPDRVLIFWNDKRLAIHRVGLVHKLLRKGDGEQHLI